MKSIIFCGILAILYLNSNGQNTGVGTNTPLQKLDVNGAIRIGNTSSNEPGSIRYNNNNFEGGDGSSWRSLEALPSKSIIIAQEPDTGFLKTKGFTVMRQLDIWDTSYIAVPTNLAGIWNIGFPLSSGTAPSVSTNSTETVFHSGRFIFYGSDGYLYAYNSVTQVWAQLPGVSPLGSRNGHGMTLIGNDIYITGGWRYVAGFVIYNTAAKYNLTSNTWTSIANMPVNNAYHATIASGTDLYILNGASTFVSSDFVYGTKLYRYNSISNTWSADLSNASTPTYLQQGGTAARNGKYIYSSYTVNQSGGNNYINIVEFDPQTNTSNLISTPATWPYTTPYNFTYSRLLATTNDKVLVMGYLPDSTDINYNPNNPAATTTAMETLWEVNLTTGVATQLNSCKLSGNDMYSWQYNPADARVYAKSYGLNYLIFNRAGTEACNLLLQRKGYWSYMKKN